MIVVSGCPRSGTSIMMLIISKIIGMERILGKKFPREDREKMIQEMLKEELTNREKAFQYQQLMRIKKNTDQRKTGQEHARMMNPNGFWECPYSVRGIKYNYPDKENLAKYLVEEKETCVKIVSQGLNASDPKFITKMIYMIRHPRNVAKSQENLVTELDQMFGEANTLKVHSPMMYINVTTQASRFISENPQIPIHYVVYDDLISNPEKVIKGVCEFMGEDASGWEKVKEVIDPTLNRSKVDYSIENNLWEDSEFVYEKFISKEFESILEFNKDRRTKTQQERTKWKCSRTDMGTTKDACLSCRSNPTTRANFKKTAKAKGIKWELEPCLFECGLDLEREEDELLSIQESIDDNFWEELE